MIVTYAIVLATATIANSLYVPHMPELFLNKMSKDALDEYDIIMNDLTQTVADTRNRLLQWATKYGVEDDVRDFLENRKTRWLEAKDATWRVIANAPIVMRRYVEIVENVYMVRRQREEELKRLTEGFSQEMKLLVLASKMTERK
ncbi:hypothetical protein Q1695_006520 [Nippostrongylus brasiliensis]|nr:hypothetical protein Q1695_006520 [Nippostrongylus brasiliensis]